MISVITITNRYGGFDVLKNSLRKQTFRDFEVIVADNLYDERHKEVSEYIEADHFKPRQTSGNDVWNLNKAYNDALSRANGELIVSLQDFIWLPPDTLQRFWNAYYQINGLISGVGHKYESPLKVTDPKGKISIFEREFDAVPQKITEPDARMNHKKGLEQTNYTFFELNCAAFPKEASDTIGGFDEEADQYYGGDNVQFAYRCALMGYSVFMDRDNEHKGIDHQQWESRPADWEEKHFNKQEGPLQKYGTTPKANGKTQSG